MFLLKEDKQLKARPENKHEAAAPLSKKPLWVLSRLRMVVYGVFQRALFTIKPTIKSVTKL